MEKHSLETFGRRDRGYGNTEHHGEGEQKIVTQELRTMEHPSKLLGRWFKANKQEYCPSHTEHIIKL